MGTAGHGALHVDSSFVKDKKEEIEKKTRNALQNPILMARPGRTRGVYRSTLFFSLCLT